MIRAFFAIDLPQALRESIGTLMQQLHENIKPLNCRFVKLDHLHITLQFLKEIQLDDVPELIKKVREKLKDTRAFEIELNQIELFPNNHHPRYISLIPAGNTALTNLAQDMGEVISKANYPIETRPYRPHVTIVRLYEAPSQKIIFNNELLQNKIFTVNEVIFYQSIPSKDETRYIPLERIVFK